MGHDIYIAPDGSLQFVYADELCELFEDDAAQGRVVTTRASHVEPFGLGWLADMRPVGGPVLLDTNTDNPLGRVAFKTRAEALSAERAWLDEHMAQGRVEAGQ